MGSATDLFVRSGAAGGMRSLAQTGTAPGSGLGRLGPEMDATGSRRLARGEIPGKAATQYRSVMNSGQAWVRADAQRSASMLSRSLDLDVHQHPTIQFEWWIEQGLPEADVALRDKEDSPARLILAFDGDRSEFSAKDAALSEWSQLMTGEPLPYATLMYVWCPKRPVGTVVHNPRTDRIRKMVVATPDTLGAVQIERDIVADYTQAFGRAPGRLIGIAIMTDSDNTRSRARTLYGPIHIR